MCAVLIPIHTVTGMRLYKDGLALYLDFIPSPNSQDVAWYRSVTQQGVGLTHVPVHSGDISVALLGGPAHRLVGQYDGGIM